VWARCAGHDPYEPPQEHWDRYDAVDIDLPATYDAPPAADAHSRRLRAMCELDVLAPSEEEIRRARRGYYGCVSYLDDQLGAVLAGLDAAGLRENTVVVLTSDHGDMLGEHGLWYKMAPFEGSARVPLLVSGPGRFAPGRVAQTVSLVDLLPTFAELAGDARPPAGPGTSLVGLLGGSTDGWPDQAIVEYLAEGCARRSSRSSAVTGSSSTARATRTCSSTSMPTRTSSTTAPANPSWHRGCARCATSSSPDATSTR
jgi:choline-sulfatase